LAGANASARPPAARLGLGGRGADASRSRASQFLAVVPIASAILVLGYTAVAPGRCSSRPTRSRPTPGRSDSSARGLSVLIRSNGRRGCGGRVASGEFDANPKIAGLCIRALNEHDPVLPSRHHRANATTCRCQPSSSRSSSWSRPCAPARPALGEGVPGAR
jgi:hypothetical protein